MESLKGSSANSSLALALGLWVGVLSAEEPKAESQPAAEATAAAGLEAVVKGVGEVKAESELEGIFLLCAEEEDDAVETCCLVKRNSGLKIWVGGSSGDRRRRRERGGRVS